jgi:hypothetical protein
VHMQTTTQEQTSVQISSSGSCSTRQSAGSSDTAAGVGPRSRPGPSAGSTGSTADLFLPVQPAWRSASPHEGCAPAGCSCAAPDRPDGHRLNLYDPADAQEAPGPAEPDTTPGTWLCWRQTPSVWEQHHQQQQQQQDGIIHFSCCVLCLLSCTGW